MSPRTIEKRIALKLKRIKDLKALSDDPSFDKEECESKIETLQKDIDRLARLYPRKIKK